MAFQIPTLKELVTRTQRAFRANLKGSDAALWPNNVAVSAKVMAGAVFEAFSFLDYIAKQINKHTAEGVWLERHAFDYGLTRLPATYAEGAVVITGDAGVSVPAGIELQRADGYRYETTSAGTISGEGEVTVTVRALEPGKSGNAPPGVSLSMTTLRDRLNPEAIVAESGIGGGADVESDESLRERLLFRLRFPPHGGAVHDYVAWAREINGVTRVFVDPVTAENGRTSVGVWFLMDDLYENGIPQVADVARVKAFIETVRPAGAIVEVNAPSTVKVDVTISDLSANTVATQNAINAALADLFRYDVRVSTATDPFTLYRSKLIEVISSAAGEEHHTLVAPANDIAFATGQIPILGSISYV